MVEYVRKFGLLSDRCDICATQVDASSLSTEERTDLLQTIMAACTLVVDRITSQEKIVSDVHTPDVECGAVGGAAVFLQSCNVLRALIDLGASGVGDQQLALLEKASCSACARATTLRSLKK